MKSVGEGGGHRDKRKFDYYLGILQHSARSDVLLVWDALVLCMHFPHLLLKYRWLLGHMMSHGAAGAVRRLDLRGSKI